MFKNTYLYVEIKQKENVWKIFLEDFFKYKIR